MRQRQESELREAAEREEEKELLLTVQYHSLEDELKGKKEKVKKLAHKYTQKKEEVKIVKAEYRKEKEEIIAQCHELTKEDQLKQSLIDFFVDQQVCARLCVCGGGGRSRGRRRAQIAG